MLQSMQANMVTGPLEHGDQGRMPNLSTFITQMLGGVHGDAVYSEEALDRIITQMMDQTHGSTAPGPASAAAIAALPRKPAEKDIMDQDGKAECSVCMDAVNIGDEITVLPCKHWFHGECVSAWLKEHDTCPHCRQGIMPKDGQPDILRSPDQAPRHSQNNFSNSNRANESASTREQSGLSQQPPMPGTLQEAHMQQHIPGGFLGYPDSQEYVQRQRHHSPQSPPTLPQRQQSHRRRNSARSNGNGSEGSSGGQGVTGWFRSLRGGSNSADR